MVNFIYAILFISVLLAGCAPLVAIDADTYLTHRSLYEQKSVLIKAEIRDIVDQYDQLKGNNVEITAPLLSYGDWGLSGWYLVLGKDGLTIGCFEEKYRYYLPWKALYLVRQARREGGEVTVRGRLRKDGVELFQLIYKDISINTNAVPFEHDYSSPDNWYYLNR